MDHYVRRRHKLGEVVGPISPASEAHSNPDLNSNPYLQDSRAAPIMIALASLDTQPETAIL
eukprot:12912341-Prorocentrum_lima.AAC.1